MTGFSCHNMKNTFSTALETSKHNKLLQALKEQNFELTTPPYAIFSASKAGIHCTLYQSGKLVVQGKHSLEWIEFFLEPNILERLELTCRPKWYENFEPHLGSDETGKGDLFGPLCVACVMIEAPHLPLLQKWQVQDSKCISDKNIRPIAMHIWQNTICSVRTLLPAEYNPLWRRFKNLNRLLAWLHAQVIQDTLSKAQATLPRFALVDQFCKNSGISLKVKTSIEGFHVQERVRAEDDPAVAAASILARAAFLKGLVDVSKIASTDLPKGSGAPAKKALENLMRQHPGIDLESVAKTHFKTVQEVKDSLNYDS